jgi:hypothetical protein
MVYTISLSWNWGSAKMSLLLEVKTASFKNQGSNLQVKAESLRQRFSSDLSTHGKTEKGHS